MSKKLESLLTSQVQQQNHAIPTNTSTQNVSVPSSNSFETKFVPISVESLANTTKIESSMDVSVATTAKTSNSKRNRSNWSFQSAHVTRLVTVILGDCHDVMTVTKEDPEHSSFEAICVLFSDKFARFVGNVSQL